MGSSNVEPIDARYRALTASASFAPFGSFDVDLVGKQVYWSPELHDILGFPRDTVANLASDEVPEHVHPDDRGRVGAAIRKSHEPSGDGAFETEHRVFHADGTLHWVLVKGRTLFAGNGAERKPVRAVGIIIDVTDRKRAEEARIRALIDVSAQIAWTADAQGYHYEDSPSWRAFTGQSVDLWLGIGWWEAVHPEDRERLRRIWAEALERAAPIDDELRLRHASGEWRWMRSRAAPLLNEDGSVRSWVGVHFDVTERHAAEAELRESEARFRQMADNAPFMVWLTTPDGACTFLSRSWYEFTGRTTADSLGAGWLDAVHPNDRAAFTETLCEARRKQEPFRVELRMRRHDGEYRWVLNAAAPRFGPEKEFKGYIGSIIDITERKLVEQALESADRRKDEFLAMLAHELRNPLAPMTTAMELLRRLLPDHREVGELRRMTERQLEHLTRLVDDLLDTSRITTGKIVLKRDRLDLNDVVRHSIETSEPLIAARGHRLAVDQPSAPVWVDGDAVRLAQVITNLLNNAAKFTPPGGRIELNVEPGRDEVSIRVRDTGIGIAADALPQLFDRFMQVDETRADNSMGIGLSLVKRLVTLHGGTVEARSEGVGSGSEFVVRLPRAEVRALRVERPDAEREALPRRILVVDDNEDAARSLTMLLAHAGHTVREAHDGRGALEVAQEFAPDVVLLDIGLPDMDGWTLAQTLRERCSGASPKIIAISGYGQSRDRERSLAAGIDRHLTKPVDYAEIRKWI